MFVSFDLSKVLAFCGFGQYVFDVFLDFTDLCGLRWLVRLLGFGGFLVFYS